MLTILKLQGLEWKQLADRIPLLIFAIEIAPDNNPYGKVVRQKINCLPYQQSY